MGDILIVITWGDNKSSQRTLLFVLISFDRLFSQVVLYLFVVNYKGKKQDIILTSHAGP